MKIQFENSYTSLPSVFFRAVAPTPVKKPKVILWNKDLAEEFNLSNLSDDEKAELFSGNSIATGSIPISQAYAGHQFGNFTMLGDGRAILLGEVLLPDNERRDIQLKGSGRTPFSRGGDGRATLSSMLREYIISEAMYYLGIPTTRSLAVVETGEYVYREVQQTGAVLTRVAKSHIRVGSFEYAYQFTDFTALKNFTDYTIQRHYPECMSTENPVLEFLNQVVHRQLDLIINWLRVGFIHGVMNTDNMSISGETIDYGPCAFLNIYRPQTVFSSIDMGGRYAFGNQPSIAHWNLACLANSLLPLIDSDMNTAIQLVQKSLDGYSEQFQEKYWEMMGKKMGFPNLGEEEISLGKELLNWMEKNSADYTNSFLELEEKELPQNGLYSQQIFQDLKNRIRELKLKNDIDEKISLSLSQENNPYVIPRNHKVEHVLEKARVGEFSPLFELVENLKNPYLRRKDLSYTGEIPEGGDAGYKTFCGT
jgi:serine/tyrosine/threonine adenylyltransferase